MSHRSLLIPTTSHINPGYDVIFRQVEPRPNGGAPQYSSLRCVGRRHTLSRPFPHSKATIPKTARTEDHKSDATRFADSGLDRYAHGHPDATLHLNLDSHLQAVRRYTSGPLPSACEVRCTFMAERSQSSQIFIMRAVISQRSQFENTVDLPSRASVTLTLVYRLLTLGGTLETLSPATMRGSHEHEQRPSRRWRGGISFARG